MASITVALKLPQVVGRVACQLCRLTAVIATLRCAHHKVAGACVYLAVDLLLQRGLLPGFGGLFLLLLLFRDTDAMDIISEQSMEMIADSVKSSTATLKGVVKVRYSPSAQTHTASSILLSLYPLVAFVA